jgi:C4-dicarboxylate-specific signal transduction histidine kinase
MHFTVSPNLIAKLLGGLGALVVFFSSYIIWRELNKLNKKEVFLRVGIILTVMVVLNDSALGLELTGAILPLYYIGNAFEAVRFNLHYQQKAAQKVYHLENEIVRLSKIAQFGFATASVAHDIANHLAIIKLTINKLIKGKTKANHIDLYKMISKHNDKVSEISTLYMNLFNKNSTSKKSNNSVKEIIDDTIELVDQKISSSNIELRLNIEDYQILCNPTEMTVCLVNLLKNAIDEVSSTSKYQAPWVSITTSRNLKRIYVSDCGDGIAPEKVKSMFDLGYSTKVNKGGHGIGLAITKQLLTRSGLSLDVDHNAKNTTFVISS